MARKPVAGRSRLSERHGRSRSPSRGRAAARRQGPSALAVTNLALIALAAGVVAWLWMTGEATEATLRSAAPGYSAKLPPPAAAPPVAAPAPAAPETPKPAAPPTQETAAGAPEPAPAETAPPDPARVTPPPKTLAPTTPPPTTPAPKAPLAKAPPPGAQPATPAPQTARATPETSPPAAPTERKDALAPAPDPALIEQGRDGPLPIVSLDGRAAWQVYARPLDADEKRPKIALVISGLGLSAAATQAAIQRLPGGVTLSFAPFADNLDQWIRLGRAAGHEILLNLPMEPINYPVHDPGPRTLLTGLTEAENLARLEWALSRVTGYVGVNNFMGSRFTTSAEALRPVLAEIKRRGLLFLDSRSSARSVAPDIAREIALPHAVNNRFIDNEASRSAIDGRLAEAERLAKRRGYAVAMGFPYPVTIERVAVWAAELDSRGVVLAPISAMARIELTRKAERQ